MNLLGRTDLPRLSLERHRTTREALPGIRQAWTPTPDVRHPIGTPPIGFGLIPEREIANIRTFHPERYLDWHRDLMDELRVTSTPDDMVDWDCTRCRTAVMTAEPSDACPVCGS